MASWDEDDGDPLREIDDRLWRWVRWQRRGVVGPVVGCPLVALVREAEEIASGSRRVRSARLLSRLPWASMIHGSGAFADPDCPEEEATDRAIAGLPAREKAMVMLHWTSDLPASEKCKDWGLSEATYWRRLRDIRWKLKRILGA